MNQLEQINNIPHCYPYYIKKVQMMSGKVVYEKHYDNKVDNEDYKNTYIKHSLSSKGYQNSQYTNFNTSKNFYRKTDWDRDIHKGKNMFQSTTRF